MFLFFSVVAAVGGLDKVTLGKLWGQQFGLKKTGEYQSEKENVNEDIYVCG